MDTDSTTTGNGIPPLMKRPSAHHAHHTAAVVGAHAEEIQQQQRVTTQPPRPVTSSIPNFIDEGDNDEDLGLDVQYVNESRATAVSATRRTWSSTSFKSNQVFRINSLYMIYLTLYTIKRLQFSCKFSK